MKHGKKEEMYCTVMKERKKNINNMTGWQMWNSFITMTLNIEHLVLYTALHRNGAYQYRTHVIEE